jgi:hypothetical protein
VNEENGMTCPTARTVDRFLDLVGRLTAANLDLVAACCRIGSPPAAVPEATRPAVSEVARPVVPDAESIRIRAYEVYQRRGGRPGDPLDDWRRAEAELAGAKA